MWLVTEFADGVLLKADPTFPPAARRAQAGYTLIELMIAVAVLMTVSAAIFNGIQNLTKVGETVNNRSEMHAGVRNATELLQQEIGQAGRISLPAPVRLTLPVVGPGVATVTVSSSEGMFVDQWLTIDSGANLESVKLTGVNPPPANTITADWNLAHAIDSPVRAEGGFFGGVVPTAAAVAAIGHPGYLNGSTPTVLKIFGDINGDGNMVYIEYTCDTNVVPGNLYRNSMPINGPKPAVDASMILLSNVLVNPGGTPCFTYQQSRVTGNTYVTDVAITLTVRTERIDPQTGLYQNETKALLNVSPRNVFQVWQLATLNMTNHVQLVPASVTALLQP
jgi:prepilin-type N-terminal cleavage/methylation domain-containing protein